MSFGARALIDASALRHNLGVVQQAVPGQRIMAVIKANAYGHGMLEVAQALAAAGSDSLGVARMDEALVLRAAGIHAAIVVLEGALEPLDCAAAAREQLELVVHTQAQLQLLQQYSDPAALVVWLKVDSGMHRLGFAPADSPGLLDQLGRCAAVREVRLMTHFANADDRDDTTTIEQLQHMAPLLSEFSGGFSVANSAALLGWPAATTSASQYPGLGPQWVRAGIVLYGVSPFPDSCGVDLGLKPAMQFVSQLVSVKPLPAGARVGYGGEYRAATDTTLGVIAAGYGDGYSRHMAAGAPVLVNGRRVPLIGRVSMDMITVDLGRDATDRVGDPVELWGSELPVETLARHADTIPYELLCGISNRTSREWLS